MLVALEPQNGFLLFSSLLVNDLLVFRCVAGVSNPGCRFLFLQASLLIGSPVGSPAVVSQLQGGKGPQQKTRDTLT